MSVHILSNRTDDEAAFYCSTSQWAFGPVMPSEEIAEAFLRTFERPDDPRKYSDAELEKLWSEFRHHLTCPYGHFEKAEVENLSNGRTVFICTEKGCKSVWDRDGNEVFENLEDNDRPSRYTLDSNGNCIEVEA